MAVESVVSFLLEKLLALAVEEAKLLKNVKNDIQFIKDDFQAIKGVLREADSMVDVNVKIWVDQLRDVAYEIEDVLDEFILRRHSTNRIVFFFKSLKENYKTGIEIQDIKARLQEISSRKERYNFSNLVQQGSTSSTAKHDPREDALFLKEFQLVGTEGPREKLTEYLLEADSGLSVVSVFGQGGLGKTTVVKKVYDSSRVKDHFSHCAWITVSQTFDVNSLLKSLVKQLIPGRKDQAETKNATELKLMLNGELTEKKFFVVLDDIWTEDAWKVLKNAFPNNNRCGSRIMVTTRFQNLAETCKDHYGHVYSLQPLGQEDSWKLFYQKACGSNVQDEHLLKGRSENILKKCNGLPLAIVAIGGLLSTKDPGEWDQVTQNLGCLMSQSVSSPLDDLRTVISFSYNDLPHYLKTCFMYFCIFPEDYSIKCSRLLRLWVAEGFIERSRGSDLTIEETANFYLNELIQRSLVQVEDLHDLKKIKSCRIHDLVRDFIAEKARDQSFATVIGENQGESLSKSGYDNTKRTRHLSISCFEDGHIGNNRSVSYFRSLHQFILSRTYIPSSRLLSGFKLLRVLDLEDANLIELPSEIENLFYLRFLGLRRNLIKCLPNSVGKLVHLETLDLKYTWVTELPPGILKLKHLRNLLAGQISPREEVKCPVGMDKLVTLEKLSLSLGRLKLDELGMLTQLRKVSLRNLRGFAEEEWVQLFASIEKMELLSSLKLESHRTIRMAIYSNSLRTPPPALRYLSMVGVLKEVPHWFSLLKNLGELRLINSVLDTDPLGVLQELPNLVTVQLGFKAFIGKKMCAAKGGFPRLKRLSLEQLYNLEQVSFEEGAMPAIQFIDFIGCDNLVKVPLGIEHLTTLQEISVDNENALLKDGLSEHSWKSGHLPRVVGIRGVSRRI